VAHLFSGTSFENGVLGWAWKGSLCSKENGYGEYFVDEEKTKSLLNKKDSTVNIIFSL
jgi:hypothetical protein